MKEVIKYHCFNNSRLDTKNDMPYYYPNVPDGFSLFCCKLEYLQLMEFIRKNKFVEKKIHSDEGLIFESDPIPNRKHFLCQICKIKFDNYKEHINSIIHCENKKKYKNTFQKIKYTFQRIVEFNKNNNNNDKINVIELQGSDKTKNKIISTINTNTNVIQLQDSDKNPNKVISTINTTLQLQDSDKTQNKIISLVNSEINNVNKKVDYVIVINDENNDSNEKKGLNINSNMEKNEELIDLTKEKRENKENEEKNDRRFKDILNILNSIGSKKSMNYISFFKKRKRYEKDMDYFDLKKITGKIFFYNKLNEKKRRKSNK